MKTELEKLRDAEAALELKIEDERRELSRVSRNLNSLVIQFSDCKKAIAELTLVKMRTAA